MEAKAFGEYIRSLRQNANLTIRQVEAYSGVSNAYLSQLENGKRGIPSPDILRKLSKPLKVSYEELMIAAGYLTEQVQKPYESSDKSTMTNHVEGGNIIPYKNGWNFERSQRVAHRKTRDEGRPPIGDWDLVPIPVLGVIRAGYDLYADQQVVDMLMLPWSMVSDGEYFCLLVQGESMSGDGIHDGDRVLVKRQNYVEDGEIAVVLVNGDEGTLKRIQIQGDTAILLASNPEFPARIVPLSDVIIQGQVTDLIIRRIKK
ncbi:MAG: helix-turn-helix domain-containing protein [Alicyclobacillus sp.]|nr:helix-turn-helix domain-containing protein [Alicyclobacillus sp.]